MSKALRILRWPWVVIFWFRSWLRRHMFGLGWWKSMAFDFPVIVVNSFLQEGVQPDFFSRFVSCLRKEGLRVAVFQRRVYSSKVLSQRTDFFYAIALDHSEYPLFTYRHLVLSITELIGADKPLDMIILKDHEYLSEVRPAAKVLAIDLQDPYYLAYPRPVGSGTGKLSDMKEADIIVGYNLINSHELDLFLQNVRQYANKNSQVMVWGENDLFSQKKSDMSMDEIRIISDHDNFGRILSESLGKRTSTNQT